MPSQLEQEIRNYSESTEENQTAMESTHKRWHWLKQKKQSPRELGKGSLETTENLSATVDKDLS